MTIEMITEGELRVALGLLDDGGAPSDRGLAELLRAPLARWGLSPRREVLRYARVQLDLVGLREASDRLTGVLDGLIKLGDCEDVAVGHERYVAPTFPRWIPVGGGEATLLGGAPTPDGLEVSDRSTPEDLVRRIKVESEEAIGRLEAAGFRESLISEWLEPSAIAALLSRRLGRLVRSDEATLELLWETLEAAVSAEGLPVGEDAELRVLAGDPGGLFGRHTSVEPEGRWSQSAEDGVWCAYRRGYGEAHWHPLLLSIAGGARRALDLYDHDEWRWALLARGRAVGRRERVNTSGGVTRLTFRAPDQLAAAMDLLGPRVGAWRWRAGDGAQRLWERFT